ETCTTFSNTRAAARALLNTTPRNDAVGISSISRAMNTVTATTASNHPFSVGDTVVVSGVGVTFDGTFVVTAVPAANQVRWAQTGSSASAGAGGTVRHVASDYRYRIQLKPIGFGIAPGDPD